LLAKIFYLYPLTLSNNEKGNKIEKKRKKKIGNNVYSSKENESSESPSVLADSQTVHSSSLQQAMILTQLM
jgi:hypothetical protein